MKTVGYIRVSSEVQDTEKNKAEILLYANQNRLGHVDWVTETITGTKSWRNREIAHVVAELVSGDWLIVPELSRLGRSTLDILEILGKLKEKNVNVAAIKGGWTLNDTLESKIFSMTMALFSEIERDFISARTKEALRVRAAAGVKLGRPKGPGKSRLDPFRPEIVALLKNGSTKNFVAKRFAVSEMTLYNWLNKNAIDATPDMRRAI